MKDLEKKNYTNRKMRMKIMQKLDQWRIMFMIRVSLNHFAYYTKKQDTFKDLYKDVHKYREYRRMRKAMKALLRNRRSRRRKRSSTKYLDKYYTEQTFNRSFKRIDNFACKHFTEKINMHILDQSSKQNRILLAFKKFIVRKKRHILSQ